MPQKIETKTVNVTEFPVETLKQLKAALQREWDEQGVGLNVSEGRAVCWAARTFAATMCDGKPAAPDSPEGGGS